MTETTELTTTEQKELDRLESKIEAGVYGAKMALLEVRDKRLYRGKYGTFEEYCEQKWGISRSQGYRLLTQAEVIAEIQSDDECRPMGDILPERTTRELSKAPKGERANVLKEAAETAPKKNGKPHVTAKHVQQVVAKRKEPEPAPEPADTTPSVTDELGAPLPNQDIQHAFELRKGFKLVLNTMAQVKKDLKGLANTPAGSFLDEQEIEERTKDVRNLVNHAIPYAVCPCCGGKKCKGCKQSGWMPKALYDQLKAAGEVK